MGYIEDAVAYLQGGMICEYQSNVADTCCLYTRLGFAVSPTKSISVWTS